MSIHQQYSNLWVSFIKQEQQQSQLNSPTVQIDINQMKLTPTQSSSAVSTPVIEQNETVFSQQQSLPSDQPNIASTVVQPKQLSDLEQELAKIHQKRYNKDQQPLSTPPVEQLLPNNVPSGNAPNTQVIQTLPLNASQSSHTEQISSTIISIPTASADSNDNNLNTQNVQTQSAARKISRFQVSVVNDGSPTVQVQPQDSTVQTQFMQTTAATSLITSNNFSADEQRFDYNGMNFQNFPNPTSGNGEFNHFDLD